MRKSVLALFCVAIVGGALVGCSKPADESTAPALTPTQDVSINSGGDATSTPGGGAGAPAGAPAPDSGSLPPPPH